jgi:hypothetical protein
VAFPTQSDPLNFGSGFEQDRFRIKNPDPQIDWEQLVAGIQSVQFPSTGKKSEGLAGNSGDVILSITAFAITTFAIIPFAIMAFDIMAFAVMHLP